MVFTTLNLLAKNLTGDVPARFFLQGIMFTIFTSTLPER